MAKKKELIHAPKTCGGVYSVEYNEDNIPKMVCGLCGHTLDDWSKWEEEYKDLWRKEKNWQNKKDHMSCILGYFVARFEAYYKSQYTFSLNEKGLFRGPEINTARRAYKLLGEDALRVKLYIDWLFEFKIPRRNKKIRSVTLLASANLIQEFKFAEEYNRKVRRDTKVPVKVHNWIEKNIPDFEYELNDFGELKVLLGAVKQGYYADDRSLALLIKALKKNNYIDDDLEILRWSDK